MLSSLRDASKGWVSKILLLLLVLSFAVWGIADQVSGGLGGASVIEAGGTKVSTTQYRLAYDRQRTILSQRIGQRITNEQARLFNIEGQVLGGLVSGAVLDEQARVMKLGISEDQLATFIAEDEAFQGLNRQFDRTQFRAVLRNAGMSEQDYIESLQQSAARQQIAQAISDGMEAPDTFLNALFEYRGQTRDVSFIEVNESSLDPIEAPDVSQLQAYFDKEKSNYRAPEYRAFKMLKLTPETILDVEAVSDSDIKAEYDNNRARYSTPETRTIQQLVFPDEEAAIITRERILAGETFEDAVAATDRTMNDVTLGTFEKSDVPDPAIADAAFELASDTDISPVIDGAFGKILVRVSDIKPQSVQPFAAVASEIRHEFALAQAQDILLNIHDSYEDARAAGSTLEEAATAQKLTIQTFDGIDRQGQDKDGQTVDLGDESTSIIQALFATEPNIENAPLAAGRDGFIWYEVTEIIEERDQSLDEVKQQVEMDWVDAEMTKALDAKATDIVNAVKAGSSIEKLAAENNLRSDNKFGLAREANDSDFGIAGVGEIFSTGPEGSGFVQGIAEKSRLIFKVKAINSPLGSADTLDEQQVEAMRNSMRGDLLEQMIGKLQREFPVSINQGAIQQTLNSGNYGGRHGGI